MDYTKILHEIGDEVSAHKNEGAVATYIPELAKISPDKFGMHLREISGAGHSFGDSEEKFSIQSISKAFSLSLAVSLVGERVFERVGIEPSGDPFNSLVQLEHEKGIPRNPLINAGALVIADTLLSELDSPKLDFLNFVRKIAGERDIYFNEKVAKSERDHGFHNAALCNLLKAFGNICNEVEDVLDFYFHQCSIEMTCHELANAFLLFANHGELPETGEEILTTSQTKRLNAIMQTCGFYDEAGEFTFRVGLPGKSGVGGGIAAIYPQKYAITVWSPRLNPKGNSVLGMAALELLTTKTGTSIF